MKPIIGFAPMDGFTDAACRSIAQDIRNEYGDKNQYDFFLWTEFMTADGFVRNREGVIHHLETTPNQKNLIAQIFGGNEETLLQTAKTLDKEYKNRFVGIELNMGCPANNVMKSGGGAELIKDKKRSLEIIKNIRKAIDMPFSIKTRTGINEQDKLNQMEFLLQASPYVDMITIHARTTAQGYGPNPDRNFIYQLKEQLPNQKIIGNGGITNYEDIETMRGNLDGVMIGQAAIGNPWIFTPHHPTSQEKLTTILKHIELIKNFSTEENLARSLMEFRKHLYSYVKGIPGSKEFKTTCNSLKDYHLLVDHITNFFFGL
ncbi:dihydrouridine synthase TIM-barrel protein nifR3 [candidate division SR1 bacterium RAAC1_SR1_1]|nr:dihydrouridine synthase TIM-barrel protein nifR3 [candidate division SR1 bacterium RAAC1_SR1_1]